MTEIYITSQMHNTNSTIPTVSEANHEQQDAYTKFMNSGEERKTFVCKDYNFTLERIWSNSKYRNIRLITKSNEFLISDNKQELLSTLSYMTKMRYSKINVTNN
jgi:hypothetical protein